MSSQVAFARDGRTGGHRPGDSQQVVQERVACPSSALRSMHLNFGVGRIVPPMCESAPARQSDRTAAGSSVTNGAASWSPCGIAAPSLCHAHRSQFECFISCALTTAKSASVASGGALHASVLSQASFASVQMMPSAKPACSQPCTALGCENSSHFDRGG